MTQSPRPMTFQEFTALCAASFGYGWQTKAAAALAVNDRTFRRWLKDEAIPEWAGPALLKALGQNLPTADGWPRDEWIVGDGLPHETGARREYIIHTQPPRFIARVVAMDELTDAPEPDEGAVDTLTGAVFQVGDSLICEIVWLDPPPNPKRLQDLMNAAADALEHVE